MLHSVNIATEKQFPLRFNACGDPEAMQEAISFIVVIPESRGNTNQWMPIPEMNEKSYASLKSVTYVKSDERHAYYRGAGTYNQLSALADANRNRITETEEVITGSANDWRALSEKIPGKF